MKITNKNGQPLKTTFPNHIMEKIYDLMEVELKEKGIFHIRNKDKFFVYDFDVSALFLAQENANKKLIKEGVITVDMIKHELKTNFG